MNLSDLPARELARLDAVCLEYESALRQQNDGAASVSESTDIDSLVARHGGEHADLLRNELRAIQAEIEGESDDAAPPLSNQLLWGTTTPGPSPNGANQGAFAGEDSSADDRVDDSMDRTQILSPGNDTPSTGEPMDTPAMASPSTRGNSSNASANKPNRVSKTNQTDALPPLGTVIGPYRLDGVLGRGGMGIVYRATDTRLERSVAVKMLAIDGQPNLVERFQREAKAVASLSHPNIVELFDVGVHQGMPYAVMEHLRGETLMRRMEPRRTDVAPITTQMVRYWGRQLAEALATSHAAGVVHRDLKPENIMLVGRRSTPSTANSKTISGHSLASQSSSIHSIPSVKLFDFGLSRVGRAVFGPGQLDPESDASSEEATADDGAKTREGMILGTPGYMAPEQARGEAVTSAADVFSLGCLLFEAFYGRPAFTGRTPASRYAAVLETSPFPDPGRRRDDVALADLIIAMLAKDPKERPTSAAVAEALSNCVGTLPAGPHANGTGGADTLAMPLDPSRQSTVGVPQLSRRRLGELIGGSLVGGLLGVSGFSGDWQKLNRIRSIGVLSFTPPLSQTDQRIVNGQPAGGRSLQKGELLASLVANELSRLDGLSVPKYVPLNASFPPQYRAVAAQLEVDALVAGTFTESSSDQNRVMDVNVQIIDAKTGTQLWGKVIRTIAGDNLIDQTNLARQVAEAIDKSLHESSTESTPDVPGAFNCLLKGRTQADPDSVKGLQSALKCFESALKEDPNYAPAHAGYGLTSLTLAGRVDDDEALNLIAQARRETDIALALDSNNVDARLASAMLKYQTFGDLDQAREELTTLAEEAQNSWQVHHQLGWVQLMSFKYDVRMEMSGMRSLQKAASLHPLSKLLQADLARSQWFNANGESARTIAEVQLPKRFDPLDTEHFARGLLIDMYEHGGDFAMAAMLDPQLKWNKSDGSQSYFEQRAQRLASIPYGPYGPTLNESILQLRRNDLPDREPAEKQLARLLNVRSPMLPLLLIKHPQFAAMRMLPAAAEAFPVLQIGAA
ncbi:protein kinase domain-containing protein [Rhodopirellula halodulae]|uniref:protein kinase domain-containing protein n=1 Tax=Rhodopirellula halodulae TaxID=2894198 RepID=UPI001E6070F7|nr:serine/threonine-protein kinase [Rhodopirellula sp. JC737]MCC9654988.1 protein kinase [Rhodopirellula sp. JC737]